MNIHHELSRLRLAAVLPGWIRKGKDVYKARDQALLKTQECTIMGKRLTVITYEELDKLIGDNRAAQEIC